jgi:hypothetical protein
MMTRMKRGRADDEHEEPDASNDSIKTMMIFFKMDAASMQLLSLIGADASPKIIEASGASSGMRSGPRGSAGVVQACGKYSSPKAVSAHRMIISQYEQNVAHIDEYGPPCATTGLRPGSGRRPR